MKKLLTVIILFSVLILLSCEKRYIIEGVQFWKKGDVENFLFNVTTMDEVSDSSLLVKSISVLSLEKYNTIIYSDYTGRPYAELHLNIDKNGYNYIPFTKEAKETNQQTQDQYNLTKISSIIYDGTKCAIMSEDFVKAKLRHPLEAKFKTSAHIHEIDGDQAVIMNKFTSKNSFGVRSEYVYKIWMNFRGGEWNDLSNWSYSNLIIEDTSTGEQYRY